MQKNKFLKYVLYNVILGKKENVKELEGSILGFFVALCWHSWKGAPTDFVQS